VAGSAEIAQSLTAHSAQDISESFAPFASVAVNCFWLSAEC